jgi:hypothetical protein
MTPRILRRAAASAALSAFRFIAWPRVRARSRGAVPACGPCTVILLNYRRPFNMEFQLQLALAGDFVGEVILSNNDPGCDLDRHLRTSDPRIRRVEHPVRRYASVRFELARTARFPYVIAIDDDLFPTPSQLRLLFDALVADPGRPHGFGGHLFPREPEGEGDAGKEPEARFVYRETREVDALVWAFAFTKEVNERYFRLLERIGETNDTVTSSEDVPLSFAGTGPAMVHDAGIILQCPSSHDDDIATYRQLGFGSRRAELVASCRAATGFFPGGL